MKFFFIIHHRRVFEKRQLEIVRRTGARIGRIGKIRLTSSRQLCYNGENRAAGYREEGERVMKVKVMKRLLLFLLVFPILCACHHYEIELYDPPGMNIITEEGEYTAVRFGYRWERERKGDAVDYVDPHTYEYTPFSVKKGETCHIRFGSGYAPEMYIIRFYPEDGGEKQIVDYTINHWGGDPRYAENYSVMVTIEESGIYTVEAVWPEWITNSVVTDATYGFQVTVDGN